jgi:MGT family glycosyltransferase
MSTFLAFTSPAAGHLFPLIPGLLELQERGHRVVLLTAPGLVDAARAAGLDAHGVDPRIPAIEATDYQVSNPKARLTRGLEDLLRRGPYEAADLRAAIDTYAPDALLVDMNAYGASVHAEASGIPWATIMPSLLAYPGAGAPPYGLGLRPAKGPAGRLRDTVLTRMIIRMYSGAMMPGLNRLRADAGLEPLEGIVQHIEAPDRLIVLTGDPLEYPRTGLPGHFRHVGAQLWEPEQEIPDWLLEEGDPWVLVTCSTEYQGDEALAAAAIEALRDEPVRVVVTLADAYGADLPTAPNARVERFVPHGPVLERAAAVVCHGGMGIVQKAIAAGVPLAVVPFGRDQPEVARRVVESGAGVVLSSRRLTPARLRGAVREAIAGRAGAQAAGARLRAAGGPARFADEAEELAGSVVAGRPLAAAAA